MAKILLKRKLLPLCSATRMWTLKYTRLHTVGTRICKLLVVKIISYMNCNSSACVIFNICIWNQFLIDKLLFNLSFNSLKLNANKSKCMIFYYKNFRNYDFKSKMKTNGINPLMPRRTQASFSPKFKFYFKKGSLKKKNSYDRRANESVDEKSLYKVMSRKTTKKIFVHKGLTWN